MSHLRINKVLPHWEEIHTIIFDFDGVFTNNKVWVDQNGCEFVQCDRGDGLAFDILRRFVRLKNWALDFFILSTETNPVVTTRARKLQIPCVQGVPNKAEYLQSYLSKNEKTKDGLVYVGNDLNDMAAMQMAGFAIAPSDAHPIIIQHADFIFPQEGGDSFVRAIVERLVGLENMSKDEILRLL